MGRRHEGEYKYYNNIICPVCGHRPHTAVQCQRWRARICLSCCKGCPYYLNIWNPSCSYLLFLEDQGSRVQRTEI